MVTRETENFTSGPQPRVMNKKNRGSLLRLWLLGGVRRLGATRNLTRAYPRYSQMGPQGH